MRCKTQLYNIIDNATLFLFRRAKYYRDIGIQYRSYLGKELPEALNSLGKKHRSYLERNLMEYKNWAYLDVQGQALLIDMDICKIDIESNQPKSNQSALAAGLLWYSIKLADNYIDENSTSKAELEDFIYLIEESWKNRGEVKLPNKEKQRIINSTSDLIHSGYVGQPAGYISNLEGLCNAELKYSFSRESEKVEYAKTVGKKSAELTINLTKQYIPEYPNGLEDFIIEQGITGKLFDDFKDIKKDRELGRGYQTKEIPNLMLQGIIHFYRHFEALPSLESKWRNLNFIALASIFHLREMLGIKEKS